ncbi:MAG: hypothetical protein WDM96_18735 [Lacunisphaera sp.]
MPLQRIERRGFRLHGGGITLQMKQAGLVDLDGADERVDLGLEGFGAAEDMSVGRLSRGGDVVEMTLQLLAKLQDPAVVLLVERSLGVDVLGELFDEPVAGADFLREPLERFAHLGEGLQRELVYHPLLAEERIEKFRQETLNAVGFLRFVHGRQEFDRQRDGLEGVVRDGKARQRFQQVGWRDGFGDRVAVGGRD